MKGSTLLILGIGAAALIYLSMRRPGAARTGKPPVQPTANNTRTALERAAVNVGERLVNEGLDRLGSWWNGSGSNGSVSDLQASYAGFDDPSNYG